MITTKDPTSEKLKVVHCPGCEKTITSRIGHLKPTLVCGYCGSVFTEGQKTNVFPMVKPKEFSPLIPIGTKGKLKGTEYEVVGAIERRVSVRDQWIEYLLYNPFKGFAWLTNHDKHWNFVKALKELPIPRFGKDSYSYLGDS